ncbi:hypothetical protein BCR43DRAFT_516323 [Syncephalastrum racemosum]|uniref:RNB domain-containing protein n=1 Tax=Syncephalastrum racemosum TaxID=13706 RepID=A0A1X2H9C4_SYNRA|nr:hypothetical protein BCR43DRAFT_516323 [Syncephalastrum racemosum]
MASGDLLRGVLRINRFRRQEAYVATDESEDDIFIFGERARNRALEGSVVAVRLIDPEIALHGRRRFYEKRRQKEPDMAPFAPDEEEKPKRAGKIVGILEDVKNRRVVGTFNVVAPGKKKNRENKVEAAEEVTDMGTDTATDALEEDHEEEWYIDPVVPEEPQPLVGPTTLFFKPLDTRTPLITIPVTEKLEDIARDLEKHSRKLFLARIESWPAHRLLPTGSIIQTLGEIGDMATETRAILAADGITPPDLSNEAKAALPPESYEITERDLERTDRRIYDKHLIFTIDPATAKDLDDALYIARRGDGTFDVTVHIADVSYFIKAGTPLDTEVRERGSSTYLVDQCVPMLPSVLSNEACSLKPNKLRYAFSISWHLDAEANVLETNFEKTVIKSIAQFSYKQVQAVLDGGELPETTSIPSGHSKDDLHNSLRDLHRLAQCRRKRRFDVGALALSSPRLTFIMDANGEPISVTHYEMMAAHQLVEEFMLLANETAARQIYQVFPDEALLRRHEQPVQRKLNEFKELAKSLGVDMELDSSKAMQRSFDAIQDPKLHEVLIALGTKPIRRARYICSGRFEEEDQIRHFALNVPLYTHFTSPIRRYADIVVHRQLDFALQQKAYSGYARRTMDKIVFQCNYWRDRCKHAEEASVNLYLARYISAQERANGKFLRTCIVIKVDTEIITVYLLEYGIEQRVYLEDLPLETWRYHPEDQSITLVWLPGVENDLESFLREIHRTNHRRSRADQDNAEYVGDRPTAQRIKLLTSLETRLQVNSTRSPPSIKLLPVNPFLRSAQTA